MSEWAWMSDSRRLTRSTATNEFEDLQNLPSIPVDTKAPENPLKK